MIKKNCWWIIPCLALLMIAPFSSWFDLTTSSYFYSGKFVSNSLSRFLYTYGVMPGLALGWLSLLVLLISYCFPSWKRWRSPAWVVVLTIAIGAGFIVHTVFKEHWGRPRPIQITEFGGSYTYLPFYQPDFHQIKVLRSFPCGHCTMGFCFFAPALAGRRLGYKFIGNACFAYAIAMGIVLGICRIAQGGHFFTDVLASALILWICSYGFDKLIFESRWAK